MKFNLSGIKCSSTADTLILPVAAIASITQVIYNGKKKKKKKTVLSDNHFFFKQYDWTHMKSTGYFL